MRKHVTQEEFELRFPSEEACLEHAFRLRSDSLDNCPGCSAENPRFYRVKGRRCYECGRCGHQVYPLAGTVMHGSRTPVRTWFRIVYSFYVSRNGVSAAEVSRTHGLTYKAAWSICAKVRLAMREDSGRLSGIVEVDESFFGGRKPLNREGKKGIGDKMVVFGMLERGGAVRLFHVASKDANTLLPLVSRNVEAGSTIHTDRYVVYGNLPRMGYDHRVVSGKESGSFKGGRHTNGIEGVWTYVKRSMAGTFHQVGGRHLQSYLDEFAYRYGRRHRQDWLDELLGACLRSRSG